MFSCHVVVATILRLEHFPARSTSHAFTIDGSPSCTNFIDLGVVRAAFAVVVHLLLGRRDERTVGALVGRGGSGFSNFIIPLDASHRQRCMKSEVRHAVRSAMMHEITTE